MINLETVTRAREDISTMEEPQEFSSAVTEMLKKHTSGPLHDVLQAMVTGHRQNQLRRAEVLKHEDLRKRLVDELRFARATDWNGYVPPATVRRFSTDELCRSVGANGQVRFNQRGRYAIGERPNDSPRRRILVEISQEAASRVTPE